MTLLLTFNKDRYFGFRALRNAFPLAQPVQNVFFSRGTGNGMSFYDPVKPPQTDQAATRT